ncbi:MAG: Rpn family recombination-promoting nuclease/putative transposase [Treponema sp.]|nr:Rpn family recombination-promoting nuclease/putative transposase [Treponema sp.]
MNQKIKETMQEPLLNPCADPIFKILFTDESEEAHEALTCFLSDILEREVTDVVLQPNELSGETDEDKQTEFDINCKIDGKFANIEMQGKSKKSDYGRRAEYHAAHLLNHYTPKKTDWDKVPQVFQISVMNFYFDRKSQESISHYVMRNKEGRTVSNTLNIIFMELPKIRKLDDDISRLTKAQMWGKFFLYANKPKRAKYVQQLIQANGGIKMAFTVLKNISQDELNWQKETHYWMRISDEITMKNAGIRQGLRRGRIEGKAEGRKEKAEEVAIAFLIKGTPPETIAECVKLPLERVLELKKSIK